MTLTYPSWIIGNGGRVFSRSICKLLGLTPPTPWKEIKRQGKWYMLDLPGVPVASNDLPENFSAWLDENIGHNMWQHKVVWLYNPLDGDIPMYRIYFPSIELLVQFRLVWFNADGG